MQIFKENRCKDLRAYRKIPSGERKSPKNLGVAFNFDRQIVVIDEAAEMFLSGALSTSKDSQSARRAASKISRLGRAVGIHLIIGTQRPDARALDTQIKANLVGKICFQMGDTASSMVVLSNGRARDLPAIPGRAIWQAGIRQTEVQVPFISIEDTEKHLKEANKEN